MTHAHRIWLALALLALVCLRPVALFPQGAPDAGSPAEVRYTVSLDRAPQHLLQVQVELGAGESQREVQLPVWNALYQVRDFSQFVNWVRAKNPSGSPLPVRVVDKTTWQISGANNGARVEYEVFADQAGPYGAQADIHHAFFNLAEILMYPVGGRELATNLRFTSVPAGWKFATALGRSGEWFQARNYDQLVDAPVEIGTFQEWGFEEGGGHYRVVVDADPSDYDMDKIVVTVHRIVVAATRWMGDRPFETYTFLYHFPRGPGGGGMEHANCTAIDFNARLLKDDPAALVDVTAHEFFHLWNVKRIRPQSLEPVDYTRENYTTALWFSEGVTSAVADLIQLQAGLLDEPGFLSRLGRQISQLEKRPAHLTQSAEESSLDAWLEKYPYYQQPERSISYYNKGELLGIMLDLALRDQSRGKASLRDLLRWMNRTYAQQGKFFADSAGVRQAAETVSRSQFDSFFQKYVAGTEEIPWNTYLAPVGLRVERRTFKVADLGFLAARNFDAPPSVIRMQSGSEAERAGLTVGDAIEEIDGRPASSDFRTRLEEYRPGDTLRLRIRNRQGVREVHWKLGHREEVEFQIKDVDNVTVQQKARRAAWLSGESQVAGDGRP